MELHKGSRDVCHLEVTVATSSDCFPLQALSNGDLVRVQREGINEPIPGERALSNLGTVSLGQPFAQLQA